VVESAYALRNLSINTVSLDPTQTTQLIKYPISADVIYLTSCFGNCRVSLLRCKAVCATHHELLIHNLLFPPSLNNYEHTDYRPHVCV